MEAKWTLKELQEHTKVNVKDYSAAVVIAGLYHKLYGECPKIGLSGHQGGGAEFISSAIPEPKPHAPCDKENE